ncbi:MAG TPA: hypothetical protein PKM59_12215 [Thermodesulfobacteriota bacterium]|nr:hypothetical protein [Thermodesulfobacteriota bacterium]HNU70845.1 hypothetical protein [Thermodesulfobacteriota bacterium]
MAAQEKVMINGVEWWAIRLRTGEDSFELVEPVIKAKTDVEILQDRISSLEAKIGQVLGNQTAISGKLDEIKAASAKP